MTDRPILFNGEMVRAILEGRKTQTRRVIKPQPDGEWAAPGRSACPYGQPGDRLWVRETWGLWDTEASDGPESATVFYKATDGDRYDLRYQRWRPSIHMPRWASRVDLGIVTVRVERLRDIGMSEAEAEGYPYVGKYDPDFDVSMSGSGDGSAAAQWFRRLWDSINAARGFGWYTNPWVWAVSFEPLAAGEKA